MSAFRRCPIKMGKNNRLVKEDEYRYHCREILLWLRDTVLLLVVKNRHLDWQTTYGSFDSEGEKMIGQRLLFIIFITVLIVLSGIGDGQGFIHASTAWVNGKIVWKESILALLGFVGGAICYIWSTNFLKQSGIISVEIQTIVWFAVTIIGVALVRGDVLHWHLADQIVALIVLAGIVWLLVRVGG